jgi:beta-lactamase superfamily II metal-dependent hydrolase
MSPPRRPAADARVTVRMYNVGFGDCFLLTFPAADRPRKVLIDCGTHPSGDALHPLPDVVERVIEDVTEGGRPRIDVVIGTHRHRDHVSGFANAAWQKVEVGEVWLPWTEHPVDPQAKALRETQGRIARHLNLALARTGADEGLRAFALNSLPNEAAMLTLHEGFAGGPRRRFLPQPRRKRRVFEPALLPGVVIRCLGPSRDPEVIRDMDPPVGQSYLRLIDTADSADSAAPRDNDPFLERWTVEPNEFGDAYPELALLPPDLKAVHDAGGEHELSVAVALEKAVNGTSLMLMFSMGKAHLLFPGDAQWGTWQVVLNDPEWRAVLSRTTFYKVGHHGSHNATPVDFVENVLPDGNAFWAMISTRPVKAWPHIPKEELLNRLKKKSRKIIRSDLATPANPIGFTRNGTMSIDAAIPIS